MLSAVPARVGDALSTQDLFIKSFFSFTTVHASERTDLINIERLRRLQKLGFTIDKTRVVFGCCGKYWPLLTDPSGGVGLDDLTVGARGTSGSADLTLSHYLHRLLSEENSKRRVDPVQEAAAVAIRGLVDFQAVPRSVDAPFMLGFPLVSLVSTRSLSLQEFQQLGVFRGLPTAPVNTFQEEDLLGSTLTVFYAGKYMIHNQAGILACSSDLKMNGDKPCDDAVQLQSPLDDGEKLRTILPYLQGIPPHQS